MSFVSQTKHHVLSLHTPTATMLPDTSICVCVFPFPNKNKVISISLTHTLLAANKVLSSDQEPHSLSLEKETAQQNNVLVI